ncbi:MAG: tRNA epoxyqueuosine(34) reductase QueG [Magnetococcales bacterium]|nr:tRNA epoxyqueuosine(34) reductase QueG [Magnetococcales bacterium]
MPHSNNHRAKLKEQLRRIALDEGFDPVAFAPPHRPPQAEHLTKWLNKGSHGDMEWMAKNPEKRQDPNMLMAGLGSIMVLGVNYRPLGKDSPYLSDPAAMGVSAYARNNEYQDYIKKKLKKLARKVEELLGRKINGRIFVDTAPLLEKPIAANAGLGWQGKNCLLVNRRYGCWLFLAEFFLDLDLPPDQPGKEHCGSCDRCQKACPTKALDTPWQLDARECLAYMTIESAAPIPHKHRKAMGNRVFGCDDCLTVCPWNRFAPYSEDAAFKPRPVLTAPKLLDFAFLDEDQFRSTFKKSAIKRSGRIKFMRNLAIALGNWGDIAALPALKHLFTDENPMVRGHAAWGLGQIATNLAIELLKEALNREEEQTVLYEIKQALLSSRPF